MAHPPHQRVPLDPDRGLDDIVRDLGDDSRKLLSGEIRLAKLEAAESLDEAGRGGLWLALGFGVGVVALVAFTISFATLFGRLANGHYWVGALLTAVLEIALGLWLVKRGLAAFGRAPYSLPETRAGLSVIKGD